MPNTLNRLRIIRDDVTWDDINEAQAKAFATLCLKHNLTMDAASDIIDHMKSYADYYSFFLERGLIPENEQLREQDDEDDLIGDIINEL